MNNSARTIYLASPYGFSEQWKRLLLPEFIAALEALGLEVWEPFARNGQVNLAEQGWAYRVAKRDLQDVRDADALFAIVNGTPPDEGVMVELGAAIALVNPPSRFGMISAGAPIPSNIRSTDGVCWPPERVADRLQRCVCYH